jgi:hypothetical protein
MESSTMEEEQVFSSAFLFTAIKNGPLELGM